MPCTACIEFTVLSIENRWIVEQANDSLGTYENEQAALPAAINEALKLREQGTSARASIKNCSGNTQVGYCLCKQFKFAVF